MLKRSLLNLFRHFAKEDRAIAAVEFALILPVMLLMYIGTAEGSRLFIMDRKVAVVAGSIGDLVARMQDDISVATLNDFFQAAEYTMLPYPSDDLEQTVTSVFVENDGTGTVRWSRGFNGGSTYSNGSSVNLPSEMAARFQGKYLIIGEAEITWMPIVEFIYQSGFDIQKTYYFRPRFDTEITLS